MSKTDILTQRQEEFCLGIVSGLSASEAIRKAGYGILAETHTTSLLKTAKIKARIEQLRAKTASEKVMTVRERKERLSTIGREDLTNDKGSIIRSSNTAAIQELNKMEKVGREDTPGAPTININIEKAVIDARDNLNGSLSRLAERARETGSDKQAK